MFEWFKMELQKISRSDETVIVFDKLGRPLPLITVISRALEYMSDEVIAHINIQRATTPITKRDVRWVVTVPVIWNEAAAAIMRDACTKAGMIEHALQHERLTLVREPEAACMDMLEEVKNGHLQGLKVGDNVGLVDLGGGTCDMMFVKIVSSNPLEIKEIHQGAGNAAGATRIDRMFQQLICDIIGERNFEEMSQTVDFVSVMSSWETTKTEFDGDDSSVCDAVLSVVLTSVGIHQNEFESMVDAYNEHKPESEQVTCDGGKLEIPFMLVKKWFDEVISEISQLFRTVMSHAECRTIRFLYMVGGFSQSSYVLKQIEKTAASLNVKLVRARFPDVAIVKGGATFVKNPSMMRSRIADGYYGITVYVPFDASKHPANRIKRFGVDDRVLVFDIFINQADELQDQHLTDKRSYIPMTQDQYTVSFTLYKLTLDHSKRLSPDEIIFGDDPRLEKINQTEVPCNMAVPREQRTSFCQLKWYSRPELYVTDVDGRNCNSEIQAVFSGK
jgi:hypothetical protein